MTPLKIILGLAAVAALAERNCREGIVSLPAAAWLLTAQRA